MESILNSEHALIGTNGWPTLKVTLPGSIIVVAILLTFYSISTDREDMKNHKNDPIRLIHFCKTFLQIIVMSA